MAQTPSRPHPSRSGMGKALREARANANLTQTELAEATGGKVHQTLISLIERGARALTEEVAEAVAPPLGLSAERLLTAKRALEQPGARIVEASILSYARGIGPLLMQSQLLTRGDPESMAGVFALVNGLGLPYGDTAERSPRAREQQQLVDQEVEDALRLAKGAVRQAAARPYPGSLERLLRLERIFEMLPLLSDEGVIRVAAEVDAASAALAIDGRSLMALLPEPGPYERPSTYGNAEAASPTE